MSRHHHDTEYLEFWAKRDEMCVICQRRKAVQMHHLGYIGAGDYRGTLPRRHSTYNCIHVCRECHDLIHSGQGERKVIESIGGEAEMYRRLTWRLHEYLTSKLAT